MSDSNDRAYEGVDNLETMAEAHNYNAFLAGLVEADAQGLGSVADFGAGTGLLAGIISGAGIDVVCIEPDPTLREQLRARSLIAYSSLDALAPESLRYAYTFNVLEHIEDDLAACRALYHRLAPKGRLLVYVPAFPILCTAMDRKVGHVRRYTRSSLIYLLGRTGFVVRRAEYVDSLGFFATLAFKWLGDKSGEIDKSKVRLYDRFVFPLSILCDRLFRRLFGKNVLVVAEKPAGSANNSASRETGR
jgi:SAM-dependent methyltransferase